MLPEDALMNGTWTDGKPESGSGKQAYINARLLNPATGMDETGAVLTDGEVIADFGPQLFTNGAPGGIATVDCAGHCLAPGLVDMRVQIREPGAEHKLSLIHISEPTRPY